MRLTFQVLVVVVAVFGVGLGVAFAGGTMYGRTSADNETPSPTPGAAQAGGLTSGGTLPAGAQTPTVGVIEQIDGNTVTLRTQAGGTVTVKLQPETQLSQSASATAADLKTGTSVVVTGQVGTDGAVEARSVQIGGAGQGSGGGARQGGASGTPPVGTPPAGATQGAPPTGGATLGTPPAGAQPTGTATRP